MNPEHLVANCLMPDLSPLPHESPPPTANPPFCRATAGRVANDCPDGQLARTYPDPSSFAPSVGSVVRHHLLLPSHSDHHRTRPHRITQLCALCRTYRPAVSPQPLDGTTFPPLADAAPLCTGHLLYPLSPDFSRSGAVALAHRLPDDLSLAD